jgi:hypothetical protein
LKIEFSLSHVFTGEVCRFSRLVKKGIAQAAMPFFLSFGFKSAPYLTCERFLSCGWYYWYGYNWLKL